ncbi:MAG TPA: hypothetical protein VHJ76_03050 [Actinomycetota bacterium]|nr:hypothetical protein [Actinomycetota bacterium]
MKPLALRSCVTVLFVGAAIVSGGGPAATAQETPPGKIAFARHVDGDYELFVMRADGSRVRRLTYNGVDDFDPSWSPDGRRIVFERERGENGYEDLYIVNVRGGRARPWVVSHGIDEGDPAWSPDGRWIAFRGNDGGDGADVVAVTVDREEGTIVSSQSENSTNSDPAWSPDGTQLALVESYDGAGLYVASFCCSDGYKKEELTYSGSWKYGVDWSPDGSCIVYSDDDPGTTGVYTIPAGGGEPRLVTSAGPGGAAGTWSPDGSEILFYSDATGTFDLYAASPDGSEVRRLTNTPDVDEITPAAWPQTVEEPVAPECGAPPIR